MSTPAHHVNNLSLKDDHLETPGPISTTAVYAGSFDPFTLGHKDIARRAGRLFSQVIIAIGVNDSKSPLFTIEEKIALIKKELEDVEGNFKVVAFDGMLAHFAVSQNAGVLIRGVRGITDIPSESQQASINREQSGFEDLETVFLPSRKEFEDVSSSATKALLKLGGDVRNYVSASVENAMRNKLAGRPFDAGFTLSNDLLDVQHAEKIVLDRWYDLAQRLRIDRLTAQEIGKTLLKNYNEPHRAFHNVIHIAEGLRAIEGFRNEIAALDAFELAWFFHDFVYDPADTVKGSNENKSKESMWEVCKNANIPVGVLNRASQFIDATINHKIYEGDLDGAFFIDTDLWILGSSAERYKIYAQTLRKEYGIYSDLLFNSGRVKFLESMLEREKIYKTDYFSEKYEAQVKVNLQQELQDIVWGSVTVVTGSIGSGKSTVMKELVSRGVQCQDADAIAAELREPGTETFDKIIAHFGEGILTVDKTIDRKALGRIVFSNPSELTVLESILHPEVERVAFERFKQNVIDQQPKIAYEVSVLFESGQENRGFKKIVFVSADEATRIKRVMARNSCSEEVAKQKIAAQLPDAEKMAKSDMIIDNSRDLPFLMSQLDQIFMS